MAIKEFFAKHKKKVVGALVPCFALAVPTISAFAAETPADPYADLNTALTDGMTSASNSMMSTIANVIPIVLVVVGGILVVTLGIRLFKRFTNKG